MKTHPKGLYLHTAANQSATIYLESCYYIQIIII